MLSQSRFSVFILIALGLITTGVHAGPVNINTADAATLSRELKGIGIKRAEAIVEYRRKFGPFKSADELALVKGIGPSAIQKNRDFIRTGDVKQGTKPVIGVQGSTSANR